MFGNLRPFKFGNYLKFLNVSFKPLKLIPGDKPFQGIEEEGVREGERGK